MEENKDMVTEEIESTGEIKIADEVVATVVGIAAMEIEGVAGMSTGLANGLYELLGKKNLAKGVKVVINGNDVVIDIYIVVKYGFRIPDIAWQIQEKVKSSVETMTGLNADKINIHIEGVDFGAKKAVKKEEKTEEEPIAGQSADEEDKQEE